MRRARKLTMDPCYKPFFGGRILRRRYLMFFLPLLLLVQTGLAGKNAAPPPQLTGAKAAVLMECRTGQILWSKNQHIRLPPASTTKIMTVSLALEALPLARVVTVSRHASLADGSSIWLEQGEQRTVAELVYGAMLNSGNDACVALAEAVADTEENFARLMTERARKLGAYDTNFTNADGLPTADHYSSAYDLALITVHALRNPVFAEIVRTKVKNIPWPGKDWDRRLINHNKLLWRYEGADGVKTGYTIESGKCLVASATRGGRRLIAVVLNGQGMYDEISSLLDYGFNHYDLVVADKPVVKKVKVSGGKTSYVVAKPEGDLAYTVPSILRSKVRVLRSCPGTIEAPVSKGQELGWAGLYCQDRFLVRVPLVATDAVKHRGLFWSLTAFIMRLFA